MDLSYVYTVSDKGSMIPDVIRSIKSLRKFVDKKEILVFFTPPTSKLAYARLSKLAIVKRVENITKPFVFLKTRGLWRYGEKCRICNVPSSTVVFLDADTIIKKDLTPLLGGDFDFSGRTLFPSNKTETDFINKKYCSEISKSMNKKITPIPDGGFMIFKNFCHKKIMDEWLRYINDDALPNPFGFGNPKELIALSLALSGMKIRWLTSKEFAFSWLGEKNLESYVVHKPLILPNSMYSFEYAINIYTSRILRSISNVFFSSF